MSPDFHVRPTCRIGKAAEWSDVMRAPRRLAFLVLAGLLVATAATADEIKVVTSGAFTAAYLELVPQFERATGHKIVTAFGPSMGSSPDAIPNRLQRGDPIDVVILAASALDGLIADGKVVRGSRVNLVRSSIGMAVRSGAAKPDISTLEAFTKTVMEAGRSRSRRARAASTSFRSCFPGSASPTRFAPRAGWSTADLPARSSHAAKPTSPSSRSASCFRWRASITSGRCRRRLSA